jgi:beta-glucanase (GH16 family)
MPTLPSAGPTRDEEERELAWLLERPEISRSANLVRLLTFVCARSFEGRSQEIRESAIAVEALGRRREGFDSQSDPIVRVTARTLRKRLEEFYRTEGRGHRVQLVLPTGQYVPRFLFSDADAPAPPDGLSDEEAAEDLPSPPPVLTPPSRPRAILVAGVLAACALSFWLGRRSRTDDEPRPPSIALWSRPAWSDEFTGAKGALPDPERWAFETGNNGGWGNRELEVYCAPGASALPCDARHPNAFQDGEGNLVIQAVRSPSGAWTSARMKTQAMREFLYGRLEVRLRSTVGAGLWPAVWILGANVDGVGWPASGSVTIMENVPSTASSNGLGPATIRATLHGPGYSGANGLWQNHTLPNGGRVDDDAFHIYGVIWSPNMIQFYVDDPGNVFSVRSAADVPAGGEWVFNHPFFLVLYLAVGGMWPGSPDATTPSPSRVWVDYVRLYLPNQVPGPTLAAPPLSIKAGRAGTSALDLNSVGGSGRVYLSCSGAPAHSSCAVSPTVVDFSDMARPSATVTVSTRSGFGPSAQVTAAGSYAVAVTAVTVSGDTSTLSIPLRVN